MRKTTDLNRTYSKEGYLGGVGGREVKRKGYNCNIISKVKDNKIIYPLVKSQPRVTHLMKIEHFFLTMVNNSLIGYNVHSPSLTLDTHTL